MTICFALANFVTDANEQIKEYMRENTQWRDMDEDDLEEFKDEIVNTLFNSDYKFKTLHDCSAYVGDNAIALAEIIDYVMEREEFDGGRETTVGLFNLCWYFSADFIYDEEKWNLLVDELKEETDSESDTSDE
jgi:hypothetical protein